MASNISWIYICACFEAISLIKIRSDFWLSLCYASTSSLGLERGGQPCCPVTIHVLHQFMNCCPLNETITAGVKQTNVYWSLVVCFTHNGSSRNILLYSTVVKCNNPSTLLSWISFFFTLLLFMTQSSLSNLSYRQNLNHLLYKWISRALNFILQRTRNLFCSWE